MPKANEQPSPLSFTITEELASAARKKGNTEGHISLSSVVREALEQFDYRRFKGTTAKPRQVSVRLPDKLRNKLEKAASKNSVSIGEIVRAALQDYLQAPAPPSSERPEGKPIADEVKAASSEKKAAKKASRKKVATPRKAAPRKGAVARGGRRAAAKKAAMKRRGRRTGGRA